MSTCAYCGEEIKATALICPHCRSEFLPAYTNRSGRYGSNNNDDGSLALLVVTGLLVWGAYELCQWLYSIPAIAWIVDTIF